MTVALDLKPSVEGELRAQADAAGLPIDLFLSRKLEALALEQNKQPVDRGDVVSKLRAYETELKASGIAHLFLHGSYARGTATQASDVDVIAEFDRGRKLSLLGRVHLEVRHPWSQGRPC